MASIFDGVDLADPCAVWPKLDEILNRLLAGEMTITARFGDDEQTFQRSESATLERRIETLKARCAAKQGQRPTRRAITFR